MKQSTARERAEKIAEDLFTNGNGQKAMRLVLVDENGRDLGGWAFKPVVDRIESAILDSALLALAREGGGE